MKAAVTLFAVLGIIGFVKRAKKAFGPRKFKVVRRSMKLRLRILFGREQEAPLKKMVSANPGRREFKTKPRSISERLALLLMHNQESVARDLRDLAEIYGYDNSKTVDTLDEIRNHSTLKHALNILRTANIERLRKAGMDLESIRHVLCSRGIHLIYAVPTPREVVRRTRICIKSLLSRLRSIANPIHSQFIRMIKRPKVGGESVDEDANRDAAAHRDVHQRQSENSA